MIKLFTGKYFIMRFETTAPCSRSCVVPIIDESATATCRAMGE